MLNTSRTDSTDSTESKRFNSTDILLELPTLPASTTTPTLPPTTTTKQHPSKALDHPALATSRKHLKYCGLPTSETKTCGRSALERHYTLSEQRRSCSEILQMYALRIPHSTGGIMLNIMGLTSWCTALHHKDMHSNLNPLVIAAVQSSLFVVVLLLLLLTAFKLLVAPKVVAAELLDPETCGAYGALLMAVTLLFAQIEGWNHPVLTYVAVAFTSLLQFAMLCWYIGRLVYLRVPPTPSCFPATVGIGMSAIAGNTTHVYAGWIQSIHPAFILAVACAVVLFPWVAWRLVRDNKVAGSPAVFVLAAPWSLCMIAFFNTMALATPPGTLVIASAHAMFVLCTVGMCITVGCAFVRRTIIFSQFWRVQCAVHPTDADVTFPIVAYSLVCMYYSIHFCDGFLLWWAWLWVVVCGLVVGFINISFLTNLPTWIRRKKLWKCLFFWS